ncbi:alpha/beta fold hydrolase [Hoeflea prorocentri]|uniref:Alpha/beta hydrolase n=1 Tax=Hoeflea prorocentri TaxID=1922333 RepID=A0A9X3ZGK2_9HYPH|nr:alpha/beta hydrolase [Hoeflea prorocentri]MCY6379876.1 alpha/beta hydrolase [Hoeflea prorocentri]MDA5397676.1 alpha/beta hydrolase [Hoeflea prorocentri]
MSGFDEQTTLASPTGANLNLFHMHPKDRLRAVVQINHGLAEHAARYLPFAQYLSQIGFAVFAHDHRGHGHTRADDAPLGRFATAAAGRGWEKTVADTLAVNLHAQKQYADAPLITFGHSMGGLIAMNFALSHPDRQAALAVWNSNFKMGFEGRIAQALLAAERMLKGSDVPSGMLPRLTFQAWGKAIRKAETPFDWLSHDPAAVSAYIEDPLCGWDATVSLWQDIFAMAFRGSNPRALAALPNTMPVHLVGGGQDPATAKGGAVTWFARKLCSHGKKDVTGRIYEGLRHETLNESAPPGARGAMEDFAAWALSALQRSAKATS